MEWQKLDFGALSNDQREICHGLLQHGEIDWFLTPSQSALLKWIESNPNEELVICICRQFGKSFMLLAYCVAYCLKHPGIQVLFVAPTHKHVKEIVDTRIGAVFSFLPTNLLPLKHGLQWIFPHNGSTFAISGVNLGGGARLRGTFVPDLVIIDECREIPRLQDVIESAIMPMFTTTGGRLILISTPPESPAHAFTDRYIKQAIQTGSFYTATYMTNALLKPAMLRRLIKTYPGGIESQAFRREYLADYSVTDPSKRVVVEWDTKANAEWFETYKGPFDGEGRPIIVRPYTFMDFGFGDPCGLLFGYYDWYQGALIICDEWFERGMNTADVAMKIKEREALTFGKLAKKEEPCRTMDIDPSMMSDLRRYDIKFAPYPQIGNSHQMLARLRLAIIEGKIRVHPDCKQLIFQCQTGVFNEKHSDYVRTDRTGHLDLVDALKYGNLAVRWNELLYTIRPKDAGPGQIVVGTNPFANRGTSFGGNVIQRPV